ncbi:MAG: DUF1273 family protein [Ruminococcus sp.]|nr:DUF1273 family protein [Ruminococcus sp.]
MYRNCCFTGHRNIRLSPELKQKLNITLKTLIRNGITDFYAGGALGWDSFCEIAVLRLRSQHPQIRLHLILPCSEDEQTAKWNNKQKSAFHAILTAADSVEYISQNYYTGCMKERNARLIALSDFCVCYYDHKNSASGTGQTVRMALSKGIKIYNLADTESLT